MSKSIMDNKSNVSVSGNEISNIVRSIGSLVKQDKPQSFEQWQDRIDSYFVWLSDHQLLPTVESLSLYCGYTRQGLWEIMKGNKHTTDGRIVDIVKTAWDIIQTTDAQLVTTGKINPVTYIFRAKNYYNMSDRQDIQVIPTTSDTKTATEIAAEYKVIDD